MKAIILSLVLVGILGAQENVRCSSGVCKTDEVVSFMGYDLYKINYEMCKKEEKIMLEYNIDVSKEKNNAKLMEKYQKNNTITKEDRKILMQWMSKTKDAHKGTTYEVICSDNTTELKIDGVSLLILNDGGMFGKKFLNIWAGSEPVDDGLRERIIESRNTIAAKK